MRLHRCDPFLNDAISALDERLRGARRKIPKDTPENQQTLAWTLLSSIERQFVRDEIAHCIQDRCYYLGAYHVIRPEQGPLTCLYPFRDHQYQVEDVLTRLIKEKGEARIIILKERQSGMTEYCCGVMCWRTFFIPDAFTVTVAQDPDTSSAAQRKIVLAYNSLPWWMRPEQMYFTKGSYMELGRKDAARAVDPGMGSVFANTHAIKQQGVAIGRTVRSLHGSEVSRWPSGEVFTGDIEPSMNATDTIGFMESTAWGNEGFFYNLWEEAMSGDSDWTPVFLAAYRDTRRRTAIQPTQNFVLNDAEVAFTEKTKREENFVIPPEFWNWRRKRLKASIARTGFVYAHMESYPITPQEAFQSSGQGAFPRHKLDEQQQKNVCKPTWVGEILFQGREAVPKVLLNHMIDPVTGQYRADVALEKREMTNRLYVWEQPDPAAAYYIGVDIGDGILGGDLTVAEVFKAGYGMEPDTQVAEWVGYEAPIAFAKTLYALGFWYGRCEIAVEYAREGTSTANALRMDLEYPKLYVPRRPDSTTTPLTHWVHWQTTSKTKPYLLTRMNESLLEDSIVIRSQYLLDELRRCVKDGMSFAGMGGHDDAAVAGCICHYCLRETMPELRRTMTDSAPSSSALVRALHPPVGAVIYGVYDPLYRLRHQRRTLTEAEQDCAANPGWTIRPIRVSKANTAYSAIHHGRGIENELYLSGMADRDITPSIVTQFAAATGRLEGMFNRGEGWGAASPGADAAQWDSTLGDLGGGELGEWSELG